MSRSIIVAIGILVFGMIQAEASAQPFLANGVKIGEVTATSASIWVRLTARPDRNRSGVPFEIGDVVARPQMETTTSDDPYWKQVPEGRILGGMVDAVQGAPGYVRLTYGSAAQPQQETEWFPVDPAKDHTYQFDIDGLEPGTQYPFQVEASSTADGAVSALVESRFRTAPEVDDPASVSFAVVTGARWKTLDHEDGQQIYLSLKALNPSFFVHTGDIVYYDHTHPYATHIDLARFRWNRMYALPRIVAFHNRVPSYFMRDDHDTWQNDCWPGQPNRMGNFLLDEGQAVFKEQTPMSPKTYRTFRWGKDLQVWMTEGRDFRSPNIMPDGPGKTIWGSEQMAWFKRTVSESDATFKILISPSPVVGPDHANKFDNHSNVNFTYEGDIIRVFLAGQGMIVVCGDRHWQYASQDTKTGLFEYSCGPTTDEHSTPLKNDDQSMIRYVGARGGFLSVAVERVDGEPRATFRHHDVKGKVVNEETHERE